MASKLCCIAEQEGRAGSPDLPNARISAATPVNQPLLPPGSTNSQFTSARSEDLLELRQIFDHNENHPDPPRAPRARSSRPSIYSLHSLHKMTSMRSILKRKFSKDMSRKPSNVSAGKRAIKEEPETMVRHAHADTQRQLKVTKDDLRRDLLSDKTPAEGGYDSDAEVLDDVARNVGKKTPSKRPSIHSVEWAPSSGSKSIPSSLPHHASTDPKTDVQPYQIQSTQALDLSTRLTQVFSTPNLRAEDPNERDRKLRRSHSATSMGLPKPSPLSPLRLPSLTSHDQNGVSWSDVMSESLRLSTFPIPPRHDSLKPSKTSASNNTTEHVRSDEDDTIATAAHLSPSKRAIEIRVQQPTSVTTHRPSASIRRNTHENAHPAAKTDTVAGHDESEESDHRRSVHLYSMRISHHLRSGSLLSWDELADAPHLPAPPRLFRQRTVSDQSRFSNIHDQLARHERQSSSSGFASSKVPSRWGKVVPNDHDLQDDVSSSVYSSRPQSPPDSKVGSMTVVSQAGIVHQTLGSSLMDLKKLLRSSSFPTNNEDTPRPLHRHGLANSAAAHEISPKTSLLGLPTQLARKNSVADTKKSKFREEFSPSPPKKKLTPSTSIMKFLNPKRLSLRSLSEANLRPDTPPAALDGPCDTLPIPTDRERRQSRSLVSLKTEQDALKKSKGVDQMDQVWDKALKAHQEEKASMFLSKNKELAVHASPFRERSGSASSRRPSAQDDRDPTAESSSKRFSAPVLQMPIFGDKPSLSRPEPVTRRSATTGRERLTSEQEVAEAFDKQGDGADIVGAWGSYPSHNRMDRTLSLGKKDHVQARDFALETALRDEDYDEELVGPTERVPTSPLLSNEKKRKRRVGTGKMPKSHSMTFGRKLIQNYYANIFKSSSSEFRQHGRGHRSSIATGGTLENPELELLPEVFMSTGTDGARDGRLIGVEAQVMRRHSERRSDYMGKGKLPTSDSTATLRPGRNSSAPNLQDLVGSHDGADDSQDRACLWSTYYETLVPLFPRLSSDSDTALDDFGGPSRMSFDNKRGAMHSHTVPSRHSRHSRNMSQLSRLSSVSSGSADNNAAEAGNIVSVRRSTMDLISKFKEQETTEHERVMSLTRAESRREAERLAAF